MTGWWNEEQWREGRDTWEEGLETSMGSLGPGRSCLGLCHRLKTYSFIFWTIVFSRRVSTRKIAVTVIIVVVLSLEQDSGIPR